MQEDLSRGFGFVFSDLQRINLRFIANGKRLCFPMKTCQKKYFLSVFFFANMQLSLLSIGCELCKLENLDVRAILVFWSWGGFRLFFPHSRVHTLWSESIQRKYAGCLLLFLLPGRS